MSLSHSETLNVGCCEFISNLTLELQKTFNTNKRRSFFKTDDTTQVEGNISFSAWQKEIYSHIAWKAGVWSGKGMVA